MYWTSQFGTSFEAQLAVLPTAWLVVQMQFGILCLLAPQLPASYGLSQLAEHPSSSPSDSWLPAIGDSGPLRCFVGIGDLVQLAEHPNSWPFVRWSSHLGMPVVQLADCVASLGPQSVVHIGRSSYPLRDNLHQ